MSDELFEEVKGEENVELIKCIVMIPRPQAFNYFVLETGAASEFIPSNKRAFFEGETVLVDRAKVVKYAKHGWIKALKEM